MKREYAKELYKEGKITIGQGAEMCDMCYYDFMCLLSLAGIPVINYSVDDFKEELKNIGVLQ
jgi:predicted HTH domain antitoxin